MWTEVKAEYKRSENVRPCVKPRMVTWRIEDARVTVHCALPHQRPHKGYILGGLVWFTIPFALATALGLAGNALNVKLTGDDAGSGLVPPAAGIVLLGKVGGYFVITQLTMAILSTGSAECIAVSSLLSYDIYRTYIKPDASGMTIMLMSRAFVCIWALVMAIASIVLNEMGVGLGYVYNFMATALGSAVVPIACSIYTDKLDATFAIAAAVLGMISALIAWLGSADANADDWCGPGCSLFDKSGTLKAQLVGGITALLSSFIICMVGCIVKPQNFDWSVLTTEIKLVGGDGGENAKTLGDDADATPEALLAAKEWIFKYGVGYSIFLVVLWPLACIPMGVFGKSSFQLWAAVALMWGWCASIVIIVMPVYESWDGIKGAIGNMIGKSSPAEKASSTPAAEVGSA